MAKPTQGTSRSRTGARRSHLSLKKQSIATCASCGAVLRPHRACADCGNYKGRSVKKGARKSA